MFIGFYGFRLLRFVGHLKRETRVLLQFLQIALVLIFFLVFSNGCSYDTEPSNPSAAKATTAKPADQQLSLDSKGKPNVIVIEVDCLRADHVGSYGYSKNTTPNVDRLAENGLLFEKFFTTSTWTRPSVASLICSQYPGQIGISDIKGSLPGDRMTLAMLMRLAGLYTVGFVANGHLSADWGFHRGYDEYHELWRSREFDPDRVYKVDGKTLPSAENMSEVILNWLDNNHDKRFFLYSFFIDPHDPYTPPEEFAERFSPDYTGEFDGTRESLALLNKRCNKDPEPFRKDIAHLTALYDAEIAYFDRELGRIIEKLKNLDLLDKTLLVFTADHGEAFWEHGKFTHGKTIYQEEVHVPLILHGPQIPKGKRLDSIVSMIDIMPSLLEYVGGKIPPKQCDGRSFWSLVEGKKEWIRPTAFVDVWSAPQKSRVRGVMSNKYKIIEYPKSGRFQFYNYEEDPEEKRNLFRDNSDFIDSYKRILRSYEPFYYESVTLADSGAPQPASNEALDNLKGLGYLK